MTALQRRGQGRFQRGIFLRREGAARFFVHAQQLLPVGDDACLAGGGTFGRGDQRRFDAALVQTLPQRCRRGIRAAQGQQRGAAAQRNQIARHIGRAAGNAPAGAHVGNGYRSFRGDAAHLGFHIQIQHGVAHNKQARTSKVRYHDFSGRGLG